MNTKLIVGFSLVVILIITGVFAFASRSDDESETPSSANNTSQGSTQANQLSADQLKAQQAFSSIDFNQSYVATITTTDSADPSGNATIKLTHDSANRWALDVLSNEGDISSIYIDNASYINNGDGWIKFPVATPDSGSLDSYAFSDDDIDEYVQYAEKIGRESCSAGMCDVWQINSQDGTKGKFWIADNGQLSKADVTEGTTRIVAEYDFSADTSVTAPTNFTELNIPSGDDFNLENFNLDSLTP